MTSLTTTSPQRMPTETNWQVWPLREGGRWAGMVPVGLVVVALAVQQTTGSGPLALSAVALLAIALWRFFLPVRYFVGPSGVTQRVLFWQRVTLWKNIQSYAVGQRGVMLFGVTGAMPLDAFRGLYVAWGPKRKELLHLVRLHLGDAKCVTSEALNRDRPADTPLDDGDLREPV